VGEVLGYGLETVGFGGGAEEGASVSTGWFVGIGGRFMSWVGEGVPSTDWTASVANPKRDSSSILRIIMIMFIAINLITLQ
jgi:hypothetical protein